MELIFSVSMKEGYNMSNFFSITNQFKFCGNPFRIDRYKKQKKVYKIA